MKNNFTSVLIICSLFSGITFSKAQESEQILKLKKKLSLAKTDKERTDVYSDLGNSYADSKNPDSAIHYSQLSLPIYIKNKDIEQIGRANLFIGNLFLMKNDLAKGEKHLIEAEKYLHKTQNYEKRAMLNFLLARVNAVSGKNDVAAKYYSENLKYFQEKRNIDKTLMMESYQGLFANNFVKQDFTNGYTSLNNYIDFVKKYYPEKLYVAYKNAGTFYLTSRDNKKSLEYFKEAFDIAQKSQDKSQIADAEVYLSTVYSETHQFDLAKKNLNNAKNFYEEDNQSGGLPMTYYYLSDIALKEKNYATAKEYAEKSLKVSSEKHMLYEYFKNHKGYVALKAIMEDSLGLKNNHTKLAELNNLVNEQKKSLEYFSKQKNFSNPEIFIQNYEVLHRAYAFLGDYNQSYSYLKNMHEKKEETYGMNKMKELSNLQSETELANQKTRIKLEEETKRIQLQKEIELKALRFEYEKKQAAAKTEEERKRLALEEDLKRKEIQIKFDEEQKVVALKYNQEKNIARINQEKKDAIAKAELESSQNQKNIWQLELVCLFFC